MKQIYKYALSLACIILAATSFSSCEWDNSPEPDHPLYVTYTISAGSVSFEGPEELLNEMLAWIKANAIIYDTQVNYTSGTASEFAKTDAEATQKYETQFMPKFRSYLNEVKGKLASGAYGSNVQVKATFYTFASRGQGEQRDLKYEQVEFVFP